MPVFVIIHLLDKKKRNNPGQEYVKKTTGDMACLHQKKPSRGVWKMVKRKSWCGEKKPMGLME